MSYESHHVNLKALKSGSIEELKAENAGDCKILTQGVKGFSKIFHLIPHQPLTSPIDTVHQIFLGVGKDLISYPYNSITNDRKPALNKSLQKIYLPKEIKRSVRSLELLKNFKANELKCHLLCILPAVLPPFIGGEEKLSDQEHIRKFVFCLRCM